MTENVIIGDNLATREDVREFCKWYLENVESPAKASKMKCYAIENETLKHADKLTTKSIARALSADNDFERIKRGYWVVS